MLLKARNKLRLGNNYSSFSQNVNISNFAESFSNGLAFCALIHHFVPDQIPYNKLDPANRVSHYPHAGVDTNTVHVLKCLCLRKQTSDLHSRQQRMPEYHPYW